MTCGIRRLAIIAACAGVAGAVGALAGAGGVGESAQPDRGRVGVSTRLSIKEVGHFAVAEVQGAGDYPSVLGVRVVRTHEGPWVQSWLEVALVPGMSLDRAAMVNAIPGVEPDEESRQRAIEGTLSRYLLVGGLQADEADALADAVEEFASLSLPDSPEPIRSRTVSRAWSTTNPLMERMTFKVFARDGQVVIESIAQRGPSRVVREGGSAPAAAGEGRKVSAPVDPAAFADALRAGAGQLRELEAQPPLIERGQ